MPKDALQPEIYDEIDALIWTFVRDNDPEFADKFEASFMALPPTIGAVGGVEKLFQQLDKKIASLQARGIIPDDNTLVLMARQNLMAQAVVSV